MAIFQELIRLQIQYNNKFQTFYIECQQRRLQVLISNTGSYHFKPSDLLAGLGEAQQRRRNGDKEKNDFGC